MNLSLVETYKLFGSQDVRFISLKLSKDYN